MLPQNIGEISTDFSYQFDNSGAFIGGEIYSVDTKPVKFAPICLGDILESGDVDGKYFIPESKLYYSDDHSDHSDETNGRLPQESRQTWQYIKGAKKMPRKASNGHEYIYSEGPVAMVDEWNAPARTMLTSEGSFNRSTHIVRDKKTGNIRLLTPIETERIQGFPDNWTKECLVKGEIVPMPENMRRFCMGNALVVDLIKKMEIELSDIIDNE